MASTSVTHCIACDAGKYSAAGQPLCKTCMPGKYVLSSASDNCTTCNGGKEYLQVQKQVATCGSGTFRPHGRENVLYPESGYLHLCTNLQIKVIILVCLLLIF